MKKYQHTQKATAILYAFGVMFLICVGISLALRLLIVPVVLFAIAVSVVAFAIAAWMFRSLTIEILDSELVWYFGSGFPRGRQPLSEIASAEAFRITWMYGWGIHYTPRGWLYNVSGYGAVAIKLKSGKQFCLGTDEPEELARRLTECV